MTKVFVYGTLKEGGRLFYHELVTEVVKDSLSNFSIYVHDTIPFPFLKEDEGGTAEGEVHTLVTDDVIKFFDAMESEGRLYKRKEVVTNGGHTVYAYIFMGDVSGLTKVEGEWFATFVREQKQSKV